MNANILHRNTLEYPPSPPRIRNGSGRLLDCQGMTRTRVAAAALIASIVLVGTASSASAQESAKPWMGVLLGKAEAVKGARVDKILDGTPAAKAGLKVGDNITTIDGVAIGGASDLIAAVQDRGVGQKVALGLTRAGRPTQVTLALEARPDELELMRSRLVAKPVPKFELAAAPAGGGAAITSDALRGRVVVIELWATWCGPCRAAMPKIDEWEKRFGKRGLTVIAVSEEPAATVAKFHAAQKIGHPLYRHEGLAALLVSTVVPTWVVVDRTGTVRYVDIGAGGKLDGVERAFLPLLATKATAAR